jgi:amino acid adenylation domain-containing protein
MTDEERVSRLTAAEKKAMLAELLRHRASEQSRHFPVSWGQRSLWFLHQLAPHSAAYNVVLPARITTPQLDVEALRRAVSALVSRHQVLRTTFPSRDGEPQQHINASGDIEFDVVDASGWNSTELQQRLEEEAHRCFDLAKGPVLRSLLLRRSPSDSTFLWTAHHIAVDYWTLMTLQRELGELYTAEKNGTGELLPPVQHQYTDYVDWQRNLLAGERGEALWDYWRLQMEGAPPSLDLPTDRPRATVQSFDGNGVTIRPGVQPTRRVHDFARSERTTIYNVLIAAYYLLLRRLSGQADIVIGSPMSGRSRPEFQDVVGYFVNPVSLRINPPGDPNVRELLQYIRGVVSGAMEHQDYPAALLAERLPRAKNASASPQYQTMFGLNRPHGLDTGAVTLGGSSEISTRLELGDLTLETLVVEQHTAMFDLTLTANDIQDELLLSFQYDSGLFERDTVKRFAHYYEILLEGIVSNPAALASSLPIVAKSEAAELRTEWSAGPPAPAVADRVDWLISERASVQPDAPAVAGASASITYAELDARSERIAQRLRASGVGPESRVVLLARRSPDMIAGLLGIVKSGGAFVPIDPDYPEAKISALLQSCDPAVVVTERAVAEQIPLAATTQILLEEITGDEQGAFEGSTMGHPAVVGDHGAWQSSLAYVIYTSGSTGEPKGVMLEHRSLSNFVAWASSEYALTPSDKILQFASLSFDACLEEIFPCLCSGGELVLRPDCLPPVKDLLCECEEKGITVLDLPTAYWHEVVNELERGATCLPRSIRLVIIGGERARPDRVASWFDLVSGDVRLVNTYGPTEATVVATMGDLSRHDAEPSSGREISIGRPIVGCSAYVLDEHGALVPVGVTGELYLGGAGIARGYLNQPALTAEVFLEGEQTQVGRGRLYRTGDRVRWLPNRELQFVGRNDQQVKIRGFRIELREVQSVIDEHPRISESAVVVREDATGDRSLVAYFVGSGDDHELRRDLVAWAHSRLPKHMIPAAFVQLERIPLTTSKKLDANALPAPSREEVFGEGTFVAPRNPVERQIALIWNELFGIDRVGIHDNFFELGGHSILVTRMVDRLREAFGVELLIASLFESPTVAELGREIQILKVSSASPSHDRDNNDEREEFTL